MAQIDRSPQSVVIALTATTAVQALVTMAALTVSVYAPQAAREIGVAPEAIGIYASMTYIGAMLGSLMAGGFVLRYGGDPIQPGCNGSVRIRIAVLCWRALIMVFTLGTSIWFRLRSDDSGK